MKPVAGLLCLICMVAAAIVGVAQGDGPSASEHSASSTSVAVTSAVATLTQDNNEEESEIVPVDKSMHEFMEYVFQPTYLRLKESMKSEPTDNKGWKAIKSDSLILAESCNLLFSRKPDEGAEDWSGYATASRTAGAELYKAGKAKDFAAAGTAYRTMLQHCNACHQQFEDGRHILQP